MTEIDSAAAADSATPSARHDLRTGESGSIGWPASGVRRCVDVALATVLSVASIPVMLVVFASVRLRLGAPVLFHQERLGRNGRPIQIAKVRSMTNDTDEHGQLRPDEERLTDLGRWLRSSSLDEVPQLWNVLRGDMSLIGPRPLPATYLDRYTPEQRRRLDVLPGLSGWSQVNGRNGVAWPEKLALDVWYVDHASWLIDLRILLRSVGVVLRREGTTEPGHATTSEFSPVDPGPSFRFAAEDRPEAVSDVDVAVFDGAAVLFDGSTATVHRLDGFTAGVWMSCDGQRRVGEIASDLGEAFGFDEASDHSPGSIEGRRRVDESLSVLADHGLLVDFAAIAPPCIGCDRDQPATASSRS